MRFLTSIAIIASLATSTVFALPGQQEEGPLDLSNKYNRIVIAHLVFGVLTFLVAVPAAILVARFGRTYFTWFPTHQALQIIAAIFIIITFALGNVAAGPSPLAEAVHYQVGTAIFVLFWVQVALGLGAHQYVARTGKRYLGWVHAPLGILIFGLAMWQMQSGWAIWGGEYVPSAAPKQVLYAWMGFLILLYLIGLALIPKQLKRDRENVNVKGEKGAIDDMSPSNTNHGSATLPGTARNDGQMMHHVA